MLLPDPSSKQNIEITRSKPPFQKENLIHDDGHQGDNNTCHRAPRCRLLLATVYVKSPGLVLPDRDGGKESTENKLPWGIGGYLCENNQVAMHVRMLSR
ncbi:hypothetical protein VTJ04DRAFT_6119 [Mycothermus thermophilus]|uniref:uncharacterized protein n=1 Tax=Humicola insolens TaxID=85995 RepID=UPI0037427965